MAGQWPGTVEGDVPPGLVPVVTVAEPEGLTLVVPVEAADAAGLSYDYVAGWITLRVHSALDAVGLTAAVARVLAEAGLSCNVVAGFHHDHLFVPHEHAGRALALLEDLARRSPWAPAVVGRGNDAGRATGNAAIDLAGGGVLVLTAVREADRTGRLYGNAPIAPDHRTSGDADALTDDVAWPRSIGVPPRGGHRADG